jgi:hypothetical protein
MRNITWLKKSPEEPASEFRNFRALPSAYLPQIADCESPLAPTSLVNILKRLANLIRQVDAPNHSLIFFMEE